MRRLLVLVVVVVIMGTGEVRAGSAVEKPAFAATPAELLAAAKEAPPGDWPVVILREDHDISVDDLGKKTDRFRMVFVIRSQVGVDDWGTLSWGWSPFYQDRPVVRARVIQSDGSTTTLDPSVIADAPAVEHSSSVFSDRRMLRVPLPRLQIGTVVEEEVLATDRQAIVGTWGHDVVSLGASVPTMTTHVALTSPAASKAHQISRGLDTKLRPRHEMKAGRETWVFDLGLLPPDEDREPFQPSDVITGRSIGLTTAPSWSAVAAAYRTVLDQRIADGAFELPADLPRTPTLEAARAIVAWLHRRIRYTGIEFGEASNVPWPPVETVKRGFGDCKDKATLLVAMLRQAGIRADIALLSTGPGADIDVDLAGMVFDHAIVRAVIGGNDVWIDATEDLHAVGTLPVRDQGRRVLLVANDASGLTVTPSFADSRVREIRTFVAKESGAADVTEVSDGSGVVEVENRTWLRDERAENVRKSLTDYVSREYKSKALAGYSSSPVADLERPLQLTVTATGTERVFTDRDHIDLYLFPSDVLDKVPRYLKVKPEPTEKPRKNDFEWTLPHSYEIENRIVLPPGYQPPPVEPAQTRQLGTARIIEQRSIDKNTLIVTYRFESGKRRLKPSELAELRTALVAMGEDAVHLVSAHRAYVAMAKGRSKDAIAEAERLVKLHPTEALHHAELATMLLQAGAGAAARREVARAVQIDPKSADAYSVQAWILRHDTLGRDFGFDHDHAGALAAFRKARALDPTHVGASVDLARLLERDPDGRMTTAPAELAAAAEAWSTVRKLDDRPEHTQALIRVLLRQDKGSEAEAIARAAPVSPNRDVLLIAATAVGSASAAVNLASTMRNGNDRKELLTKAGGELFIARLYGPATALHVEAGTIRAGSEEEKAFRKMTRHDEKFVVGKDPSKVAADLMLGILDPLHAAQSMWNDATRQSMLKIDAAGSSKLLPARSLGTAVTRDLVLSALETHVDGPSSGPWRIVGEMFGHKFVVYAAQVGTEIKLLGAPDGAVGVGQFALQRIAARDGAKARQLMDWLAADAAQFAPKSRFGEVWGATVPNNDKTLAVACAIAAGGKVPKSAIPTLVACESPATGARSLCDAALSMAYFQAEDWGGLERHAAAWQAREPASAFPSPIRLAALVELKRFDDADTAATALSKDPNDREVLAARAQIASERRTVDEAIRRYDTLVKVASAKPIDKNNYAWLLMVEHKDLTAAVELARAALRDAKDSPQVLNTLSVIEAELGELKAAMDDTIRAIDARRGTMPTDGDWYAVGRVYEQLGLREDAITAYRRITGVGTHFQSAAALGADRLKQLSAKSSR